MARGLEGVEQITQAAAEAAAAQPVEDAGKTAARLRAGAAREQSAQAVGETSHRRIGVRGVLLQAAERGTDLVAVLVAGHGQQAKQREH